MKRIGKAMSYPGIDPRPWVHIAYVTAVNIDANFSPLVDIELLVDGTLIPTTARVASSYTGVQFGSWAPLEKDDEVICVVPDGTPDHGVIVVGRLHSTSDKPPTEAVENPTDYVVRLKDGASMRITLSGDGEYVITTPAFTVDGNVSLGGANATEPVILGNAFMTAFETLIDGIAEAMNSIVTVPPNGGAPAAVDIKALKPAFFDVAAQTFLSQLVKSK